MTLYPLDAGVQHYPWGDPDFIPALLGIPNPERSPYAELWMGAHPDLPSRVDDHTLGELIEKDPTSMLGAEVAHRFGGRLPYLIKVLSAVRPLSIQAHPDEEQAKEGFRRETASGIPLKARERSYRDESAKPELVVALTELYALSGFRPLHEIAEAVEEVPELRRLAPSFEPDPESLRELYTRIQTLPQGEIDPLVDSLLERVRAHGYGRDRREFWLVRCDEVFASDGHHDRGLLSIFLLNLVKLRPAEALFLEPGTLHAYLEGTAVEIMASSNNVLRGGLTEKHVAVEELLGILRFKGAPAPVLLPVSLSETESIYRTPADAFELGRIDVTEDRPHRRSEEGYGPEILLALEAGAPLQVVSGSESVRLGRGRSLFVPHQTPYTISGRGTVFRAAVPARHARFRGRRPKELEFGTSGLRGRVEDITDLEAYVNTRGFLLDLLERRQIYKGDPVAIGGDLRPSTDRILVATARAVQDAGLRVENLGRLPTPALTLYGLSRRRASVMVTGSHIPFDRNGIKFVKPTGEVLKGDEPAILAAVARARREAYARPSGGSPFGDDGSLRSEASRALPKVLPEGRESYLKRYLDFFPEDALRDRRIVLFQHSAVGRDLLAEILTGLGAEVVPAGRSESFVPIDTENVTSERLSELERMVEEASGANALVSTDGDSDRPLVCAVESDGRVRFLPGDLLGILVADYLGADAVVVPVSANDAVDRWFEPRGVRPRKTRIGSPYVVEAMQELGGGMGHRCVVGWEANGGFLLGSDVTRNGRRLGALPTRDAVLPILAVLDRTRERGETLTELFGQLPERYGSAGLLDAVPREVSEAILKRFGSPDRKSELDSLFPSDDGFGAIERIEDLDGLRIYFGNGDIAHIRPSGNAPQLRIYAVANAQERADEIVRSALREPDGILRRLAAAAGA